ncbi:MAG: hypothetical protein M5U32_08700 [Myxococcota bacterium]|nr:hypothetical protein [Myxococcota bacterium]
MAGRSKPRVAPGSVLCVLAVALCVAPPKASGAAGVTYDLHFRVYCDPPAGPDLCFAKSGWKTENDIRAAYLKRVVPVLNRIYESTGVSFRLHALDYDESRPDFTAVERPSNLDPPTTADDAIRDMREIARLPRERRPDPDLRVAAPEDRLLRDSARARVQRRRGRSPELQPRGSRRLSGRKL